MTDELQLEKIKFIEQNIPFFINKSHERLNNHDNVSTALLTILLSENKLEECRNYPLIAKLIQNYKGVNFSSSFIQVISNLEAYVMKMFNYNMEAQVIKEQLDNIVLLYKSNKFQKVKKMA